MKYVPAPSRKVGEDGTLKEVRAPVVQGEVATDRKGVREEQARAQPPDEEHHDRADHDELDGQLDRCATIRALLRGFGRYVRRRSCPAGRVGDVRERRTLDPPRAMAVIMTNPRRSAGSARLGESAEAMRGSPVTRPAGPVAPCDGDSGPCTIRAMKKLLILAILIAVVAVAAKRLRSPAY